MDWIWRVIVLMGWRRGKLGDFNEVEVWMKKESLKNMEEEEDDDDEHEEEE